jgi:hypothetical protein
MRVKLISTLFSGSETRGSDVLLLHEKRMLPAANKTTEDVAMIRGTLFDTDMILFLVVKNFEPGGILVRRDVERAGVGARLHAAQRHDDTLRIRAGGVQYQTVQIDRA